MAFAIVAAVDRRWILGETLRDEALLTAPELGPTADSMLLYEAVKRTRFVPFGRRTLVTAVAPVLAPMIPLLAIEVHLVDALKIVVSTLL